MAVTLVQQKLAAGFAGSATSGTKTFTSNTILGNLILVGIGLATTSGTVNITSVTDSQSNSYSLVPSSLASFVGSTHFGDLMVAWYYANNTVGGANTITVNWSATAFSSIEIFEFSGADTVSSPLAIAANGTGTSISSGSINAILSGSYGLCQSNVDNGLGSGTYYTAGSGWSVVEQFGGGNGSYASESQSIFINTITGNFTGASANTGWTSSLVIVQPPNTSGTSFFSRPGYGSGRSVAFGNVSGGG